MNHYVTVTFDLDTDARYFKEYYFEAYEAYEVGDLVVVDTVNGFTLARIVNNGVEKPEWLTNSRMKQVVSTVDTSKFDDRKAKRERADELKKEMNKRVKKLQDRAVYELLAKDDPDLAKMLEEFKELTK